MSIWNMTKSFKIFYRHKSNYLNYTLFCILNSSHGLYNFNTKQLFFLTQAELEAEMVTNTVETHS